ncbi:MAG TPA: phenylalanine--tRNA ligase subunit beta [Candidatus Limnocylindria bacterium]|nr:phenylalanine--tRNA ligase subunit beta [Candidatus Limnocylindria bacterium]
MRVPLSWLREYVDVDLSPEVLAEELTMQGLEVSGIEVSGADWSDVVVGRLLSMERHPNADKLWLTSVDVGAGEPLQIVCGADNIAVGQLVPVALVGSALTGGRRIERTKIRGVESQGMLCSAIELGLGDDAEGIHILGTGDELPLGADLRPLLGEVVLDVDVKPNRGDALSMVGVAREVAALARTSVRLPETSVDEDPALAVGERVQVLIEDPEGCPRFTARWFEGIGNGASPGWMQRRLLAAGMRPISAVVDVTNYVMHELGQPMHAYDADAVPNGRIVVRRGRDGEELETIDHEVRTLDGRMLVIADEASAIGLAGIMGGAGTEVTESTTRVILESAIFHGPMIRNTARRLGLRSEASLRHEKGIGHHLPRLALDRAARLLAEVAGARVAKGIVDNDPEPRPRRVVTVEVARAERLLGLPLDPARVAELLAPLDFAVAPAGDGFLEVTVPAHRLDVVAPEDVAEEIARSHGYGRIPARQPQPALPPFLPDPSEPRHRLRRVLAGLGLDEVVTHALIGPLDLQRAGLDPAEPGLVRVANPLAEAHSILRPSMAPSMMASLAENVRQRQTDAWIFEVGKTYWSDTAKGPSWADTAGTGRFEAWHLGIALLGSPVARSPRTDPRPADVADLKGIVEAMHAALGVPEPAFRAETPEELHRHLHPGRAARILDPSGRAYGNLGEVDPSVVAAWDLPGRPVMVVINVPQLLALAEPVVRAATIPAAQPLDRDLAVVVDDATLVGEVLRILRDSAGPLLATSRLFDEYRGPQVGEGNVSYAISLRFQPEAAGDERAVERAMKRITGALQHHLGAQIR